MTETHSFAYPSIQDKNISKWLTSYLKFMLTKNNTSSYHPMIFFFFFKTELIYPQKDTVGTAERQCNKGSEHCLLVTATKKIVALYCAVQSRESVSRMGASHLSYTLLLLLVEVTHLKLRVTQSPYAYRCVLLQPHSDTISSQHL